ncbi:MAG: hypothetical protein ACYDDP_01800 [Acidithiobacillus sp.]
MKIRVGFTARAVEHKPGSGDREAYSQQQIVFYPGGQAGLVQTFRLSSSSGFVPFPVGDALSVVDFVSVNNRVVPFVSDQPQFVNPLDFYTLPRDDSLVDVFVFAGEYNKGMKRFTQRAEVLRDGRPSGEFLDLFPDDESEVLASGFGRGLLRLSQWGAKRPDGSRGFAELRFRLDDYGPVALGRSAKEQKAG